MIRVTVKAGKSKFGIPKAHEVLLFGEAGEMIAKAIEKRIRERGIDGHGARLPGLSSEGTHVFAKDDPRYKGVTGPGVFEFGNTGIKAIQGGYKAAKAATGKSRKRDGALTGDLWKNVRVVVKKTRNGSKIVIDFIKSSVVSEVFVEVSSVKTRKTRMRAVRVRVDNRVKASQIERDKGTGAQMFYLMSMADEEVCKAADHVLSQMRWYG